VSAHYYNFLGEDEMNRTAFGKCLLTFVLIGGAIMSFILDWSNNHLLNPLWHPHARYHAAILLFVFAGAACVATWLLWRPSKEPHVAFAAASLLSLAYWRPSSMCRFCFRNPPIGRARLAMSPG
jgi:hypothetical protein